MSSRKIIERIERQAGVRGLTSALIDLTPTDLQSLLLEWGPTRDAPSPLRGRVVNVYTDPAWRRRGLASALLERCLCEAEALGIGVLGLGTTPQARALYERLGFGASETEMYRVAKENGER